MILQPGFPRTQTGVLPKHWDLSSSCKIHSRIAKNHRLESKKNFKQGGGTNKF